MTHASASPASIRTERPSLEAYLRDVLTPEQRRSLLIPSFTQWGFALATVAETALTAQAIGSDVTLAFWGNDTPMPDTGFSVRHGVARAFGARSPDQSSAVALQRSGIPEAAFIRPSIRHWRPVEPIAIHGPMPRTAIRQLTYRGTPMGRAILQINPDRETPVTDEYLWPQRWIETAARSYAYVLDQTLEAIRRRDITVVAVYNGRFLHDRAVLEAALMTDIPVLSYDTAGVETDFDLSVEPLHDFSAFQRRVRDIYHNWDPAERDVLGSSWFEARAGHADPQNSYFVDAQRKGELIERPDCDQLVVFFSSSGDEMAELEVDWSRYFDSQGAALRELARQCRERPRTSLVVRSHPHKRMKPSRDVADWLDDVRAASPDIHLDPHSSIDSYALMRMADVVVTYGSTTGIEAAYARKPVIVMGPSVYDELGCTTPVHSPDELARALDAAEPGNRPGAVAFGLMMMRRGFRLARVERRVDGYWLAGIRFEDVRPAAAHVSDVLNRLRHRRLTSR